MAEAAVEVAEDAPEVGHATMARQASATRRGEGRRVTLARRRDGGYSIWQMSRHIQSFCAEWEEVTNFQLPNGIEQQVRICVVPIGDAREIRPEYSGEDVQEERVNRLEEVLEERRAPPVPQTELEYLRSQNEMLTRELRRYTDHENQVALTAARRPIGRAQWQDEAMESLAREMDRVREVMEYVANLR